MFTSPSYSRSDAFFLLVCRTLSFWKFLVFVCIRLGQVCICGKCLNVTSVVLVPVLYFICIPSVCLLLLTDAPSQPHISYRDQTFPFMVDTSATLYCSFQSGASRGNPEATLNWPEGSRTTGQGEANRTFSSLTPSDNGRSVVCEASNLFTDRTSPVITSFQLQVYCKSVLIPLLTFLNACTVRKGRLCIWLSKLDLFGY